MKILILLSIAALACCNSAEPYINCGPEKFHLLSGFENSSELSDDYSGLFKSGVLKQSSYYATEGIKSLQISYDSGETVVLSEAVAKRINITDIYSVAVDALNVSDNYADLSVYIQFTDSGEIFSVGTIKCPPGDNRNLRADLSAKLPGMTAAVFLFENDRAILETGTGDGSLNIDNFRLSGRPDIGGKSESFALYPDLSGLEKGIPEITGIDIAEIPEGLYEKAEIDVFLDAWIENPCDPEQIAVDVLLTDPEGNLKIMPGFYYYVPFSRSTTTQSERLSPSGEGFFKVRFSSDIPGTWEIIIRAANGSGEVLSEETEIDVPDIRKNKGNIEVSSDPRYTIARWGYSRGLFAWELWNKVNLADNMAQEETLVPWIEEMAEFIRDMDIHGHLIGNSFNISVDGSSPFWKDPDFIQRHEYNRSDWAVAVSRETAKTLPSAGKPFFYGEFGLGGETIDPDAVHFCNGIWVSLMSGAAGTAMLWWWDSYVERNELYDTFYGLSRFLENEEQSLPEMSPIETQYGPGYELYGLQGKNKSLFWINDSQYTYQGYLDLQLEFGKDIAFFGKTEGLKAVIPIEEEGIFTIEFRDTRSGEIIRTEKTSLKKNSAVEFPGFTGDIAIIVIREKE